MWSKKPLKVALRGLGQFLIQLTATLTTARRIIAKLRAEVRLRTRLAGGAESALP